MQQFFQQFTAWHFVALAAAACFTYVATTVGRRVGKALVSLVKTLDELKTTVHKTDIMWDKTADVHMFQELEKRRAAEAK